MRFQRLSFVAYGPFKDMHLHFPRERGDFHVVFGANEAGKSSMLRAIGDALFGIPVQTVDNFRHPYNELRLDAEIVARDGESLAFQRYKRRTPKDLLDERGDVLDAAILKRRLGEIDRAYFDLMFGLSSEGIHTGAANLLAEDGALAKTLFAAGTGRSFVNRAVKKLREQLDELYKPGGKVPRINKLREEVRKQEEATQTQVLAPETWVNMQAALGRSEADRQRASERLRELHQRKEWLDRCRDSLLSITRYRDLEQKLESYVGVPVVSNDFAERIRAARQSVSALHQKGTDLQDAIEDAKRRMAEIEARPEVLAETPRIERLHGQFAVYQQDLQRLGRLADDLRKEEQALETKARDLQVAGGVAGLDSRAVPLQKQLVFREAADGYTATDELWQRQGEDLVKVQRELAESLLELKRVEAVDLTTLQAAVEVGQAATNLPASLERLELELADYGKELTALHRQLCGAPDDWEQVCHLRVPSLATIEHMEQREREIVQRMQASRDSLQNAQKALSSLQDEMTRLERRGQLPSEGELRDARSARDRGWKKVLSEWKGIASDEPFDSAEPLDVAYPQAVDRADRIADQLWREAEAVAQVEEKRQQLTRQQEDIERTNQALDAYQQALDELRDEWRTLWESSGVVPRSPTEMKAWHQTLTRFHDQYCGWHDGREQRSREEKQLRDATETLARALGLSSPGAFGRMRDDAKAALGKGLENVGRRNQLASLCEKQQARAGELEASRTQTATELEGKRALWRAACEQLGYDPALGPKRGVQLLDMELQVLSRYEQWKVDSAEHQCLADRCRVFEQELAQCSAELGVPEGSPEPRETQLWQLLNEQRRAEQRLEQLRESLESLGPESAATANACKESERQLLELLKVVGLTGPDGLEEVLGRIEARDRDVSALDSCREQLSALARGEPLEAFLNRVLAEESAASDTGQEALEAEIRTQKELVEELGRQRDDLLAKSGRMEDANDEAALSRQLASMARSALVESTMQYVRLRLATHVLESQIEEFRRASQGPLMKRGGELFSKFTLGSFQSLTWDSDDGGKSEIVGCRDGHRIVRAAEMSSGTRDQLFLALRMAALELHVENREPMPLILDDLLITFDDNRAAAILEEFGKLSEKTQVLLFTHHEHLVEICRDTLQLPDSHIHRLSSA